MPKIEPVAINSGFFATDNFDKSLLQGGNVNFAAVVVASIDSAFDDLELSGDERALIACLLQSINYRTNKVAVLGQEVYDLMKESSNA